MNLADVSERFWSYVDKSAGPDACWPWTGAMDGGGYGAFQLLDRLVGSHRIAYLLVHPALDGPQVLHSCDNPPCCNPGHLFSGTHQDNMDDMVAKARHVHGEAVHTSKLTEADVKSVQAEHKAGATIEELAARHDVTPTSITFILQGRTWKHITNPDRLAPTRLHTSNPNAVLTPEGVREALALRGVMRQKEIANKFGVSLSCIESLFAGLTWRDISDPDGRVAARTKKDTTRKLSEDDVRAIRALRGQMKQQEIATKFGVSLPTVEKILAGKMWPGVK